MFGRARPPHRGQRGERANEAARRLVDDGRERFRIPRVRRARTHALHRVNRAVNLDDSLGIEARLLKLTVDIAREHEAAVAHRADPAPQDAEPFVRHGCTVHREPMAVKAPREARTLAKRARRSDLVECIADMAEPRVRAPQPFGAAKIRQSGIDADARARRDEQRIGARQRANGGVDALGVDGRRAIAHRGRRVRRRAA